MAIVDKTTLKTYFEAGDKPTESQFEDLIDSLAHTNDVGGGGGGVSIVASSTTAGSTTMTMFYVGDTAPTFSFNALGDFDLSIPDGTKLLSYNWQGTSSETDSGALQVEITDNNSVPLDYYGSYAILALATEQLADLSAFGITITQAAGVSGVVTHSFVNLNGFGASGFRIMARFI